jgi:hypothetical protein
MLARIFCLGASFSLALSTAAAAVSDDAAIQVSKVVEDDLASLARECPTAVPPGYTSPCKAILPRVTWTADPQIGAVVLYYREPGTPFAGGTITTGSPNAAYWDAVAGDLLHMCTHVTAALHHAGWSDVPVYVFALEKSPAHYFGPTTDDGEAIFLRLGPQYGGGCGRFQ